MLDGLLCIFYATPHLFFMPEKYIDTQKASYKRQMIIYQLTINQYFKKYIQI